MLKAAVLAISISSPIQHSGLSNHFATPSIPSENNWGKYLELCLMMDDPSSTGACTALIEKSPLSKEYIGLMHGYRGYGHLFKQDVEAAIKDFSVALSAKKKKPEFYTGRAMAYEKKGQFREALGDYNAAIKTKPSYVQAYDNRGRLHRRMNNFQPAIADLSRVVVLKPGQISGYYQLGFTYHKKGDYKKAIEVYTLGLKIDTKNALLYAKRGLSHRWNGEVNLAIRDYSEAIKINPEDPINYNNRAWALMVVGEPGKGLADANKALELDSKTTRAAAFFDTRAHIYEALGNKEKAIADFRKAVKVSPAKRYIEQLKKRGVKP